MSPALPAKVVDLFKQPHLAHLATTMRDGSPQVTPVWVDTDGEYVLINTSEGRVKTNNIRRDPRVAVSVLDAANPYGGAVQFRGRVVEVTSDGADDHIDALTRKYTGAEAYRGPKDGRLILKIRPEGLTGGATRG